MKSLLRLGAVLAILFPASSLGAEAAAPVSSPEPALSFRVERGSDPIGTHKISFTRDGAAWHIHKANCGHLAFRGMPHRHQSIKALP